MSATSGTLEFLKYISAAAGSALALALLAGAALDALIKRDQRETEHIHHKRRSTDKTVTDGDLKPV